MIAGVAGLAVLLRLHRRLAIHAVAAESLGLHEPHKDDTGHIIRSCYELYSLMLRRVEPSFMTAHDLNESPECEPIFGDEEIAAASGIPLPSLRVLQSAGAIRSEKSPKFHGGFRRMWPEDEVLKAAIAAVLGEHFAWNIRRVAGVMASVQRPLWNTLIAGAADELRRAGSSTLQRSFVVASELDWYAELIDRKFLFLKPPANATDMLPGWNSKRPDLLLGVLEGDTFTGISWELATARGRKLARETLGNEKARQLELLYKLALVSHGNFLSKATINLSLQVRAAWRRLRGMESRFVQETVRLRRRKLRDEPTHDR